MLPLLIIMHDLLYHTAALTSGKYKFGNFLAKQMNLQEMLCA